MSTKNCKFCGREIKIARLDGKLAPIERAKALRCDIVDGENIATDVLGEYWQRHHHICDSVRSRPKPLERPRRLPYKDDDGVNDVAETGIKD